MKVGLFVPCYVDQFYPEVGKATLGLLQQYDLEVSYPMQQTCCGQPMANSGCEKDSIKAYHHFVDTFKDFDYIVAPSGSCTYHVRKHFDIIPQTKAVEHIRSRTLDIAEFLLDVLQIKSLAAHFPHKVGLHQSCHGLRGLRLGKGSERVGEAFSKTEQLLQMVKGLELIPLDRQDECCGFGGTFAVAEAAVSAKMGKDRVADHARNGAEVLTAGDMSCLMHLHGLIRRQKQDIRVLHLVEILNGG